MNRRSSLKQMITATGAVLALPSWASNWSVAKLKAHLSSFNKQEADALSSIVDTILPGTEGKMGGKSVGVDLFLQKLFDKCYEKDINDNIKLQIAALDKNALNVFGNSFEACSYTQRLTLLNSLSTSSDKSEKDFFALLKSETIRGFTTSEQVMNHLKYKVAPGHYWGCVDAAI